MLEGNLRYWKGLMCTLALQLFKYEDWNFLVIQWKSEILCNNLPQETKQTRGLVDWACVAHLSFCFEET